jgi:hypothetical protein
MKTLDEDVVEYTLPSRKKKKKVLKMHKSCNKDMKRANGRKTTFGGMR